MSALYLPRFLARMAKCCAKENLRYGTAAVHVRNPMDGTYRVEATDGRILAIVRGPSEDKGFLDVPEGQPKAFLVPAESWEKGLAIGDRHAKKAHATVALSSNGTEFLFAVPGAKTTGPCEEGRYPRVDEVLPKEISPFVIDVDPWHLIRLLEAAAAVCGDETKKVSLLIYRQDKPVGICASSGTGHYFDGLIMPLVTK